MSHSLLNPETDQFSSNPAKPGLSPSAWLNAGSAISLPGISETRVCHAADFEYRRAYLTVETKPSLVRRIRISFPINFLRFAIKPSRTEVKQTQCQSPGLEGGSMVRHVTRLAAQS